MKDTALADPVARCLMCDLWLVPADRTTRLVLADRLEELDEHLAARVQRAWAGDDTWRAVIARAHVHYKSLIIPVGPACLDALRDVSLDEWADLGGPDYIEPARTVVVDGTPVKVCCLYQILQRSGARILVRSEHELHEVYTALCCEGLTIGRGPQVKAHLTRLRHRVGALMALMGLDARRLGPATSNAGQMGARLMDLLGV